MSAESSRKISEYLLDIEAVILQPLQPFTWASGWKSPIYCDNRKTLAYPEIRDFMKLAFAAQIRDRFPEVDVIAGVATGAIAQAVLVADILELPMIYIRPEPKGHGLGNQIEGAYTPGQKVVVIEDLISTGGSSLKAIDALRTAGVELLGMFAIFSYGFKIANETFAQKNIQLHTLTDYEMMIEVAIERGIVTTDQLESLKEWRVAPSTWGK
ncbi:MAG: hypothetical protein RIS47_293 [Bacteroidota bacterium]